MPRQSKHHNLGSKVIASAQQYIYVLDEFWMNDYNFHQVLIYRQSGCISQ